MDSAETQFIKKIIQAADPKSIWSSLNSISIPLCAYGPLFHMLGQGDIFKQGGEAEIFTKEMKVVFTNFPKSGWKGIFTGDKVEVQNPQGIVVGERLNPRSQFQSRFPFPKWDQLDILYFFGYALWNYTNFPYVLKNPNIRSRLIGKKSVAGKTCDHLQVIYPEGFHTHSTEQFYCFDEEGLLVRHDYIVEIAGPTYRGQHFTFNYARSSEGIAWATRRRVQVSAYHFPWSLTRLGVPFLLKDNRWSSRENSEYAIYGDIDWFRLNKSISESV